VGTLIGYAAAPLDPDLLIPWAASFRRVCPNDRMILLADPALAYTKLEDFFDIEVVPANLHTDPFDVPPDGEAFRGCVSVYKDRWAEVSKLDLPMDGKVLLTDTRDVFFQRNPFDQITDKITVATEGVTYKTDPWNRMLLDRFYPEMRTTMMDFPTICAGVVGGIWRDVQYLAAVVRAECNDKSGLIDQVALNVVLRRMTEGWQAIPYTQAWTCHCAQMLAPWVPARASVHPRTEETPLLMQSGLLTNRRNVPFAVVHHWPMVPQLKHYSKVEL
jgi:hypothetical protein